MGNNVVGLNEWLAVLDIMGRICDKRVEMVDKNMFMVTKVSITLVIKNELLINNEMLF